MRANKRIKSSKDDVAATDRNVLTYVEFYAGIGGWTMALEEALNRLPPPLTDGDSLPRLCRLAALDHSDLCTRTFEHNFGTDKKAFEIGRLSLKQAEEWSATIWTMSPPCQPHTRQHSNQEQDLTDPRSASFLHLCDLLEQMKEASLPSLLFLENVLGFESSNSCQRWRKVLANRGYAIGHFHLTPTQVGLPNDRPRYYCVAVLDKSLPDNTEDYSSSLRSHLQKESNVESTPPAISKHIPELDVIIQESETSASTSLPPIATFLDNKTNSNSRFEELRIPDKVLQSNSAWCFDIVTPKDRRSACFTSSYGKFNKGTGSVLYEDIDNTSFKLVAPEEREFDKNWANDIDMSKLRYFSGLEMSRLMGFSTNFSFPPSLPVKQQWKLLGNSLNVRLSARIAELGLKVLRTKK
jgi:tRNA (cytosine38-C5)-methyltransferase